jgi:hypothetical protein
LPGKREQMNQEILRIANENPQFAQSDPSTTTKASQEYEAARKARGD